MSEFKTEDLALKFDSGWAAAVQKLQQKLEAAEAECARLKEENHNALLSYVELINKREMRVSGLQDRVREALDRAKPTYATLV